jgi:hypothetical protein
VYRNNSKVALQKITKFIQSNCNTNIIIYGVPHRYDLVEFSCVNRAIQAFNSKLRKVATEFKHVTILEGPDDRELFTRHGMHLNRKGKRLVSKQLAHETATLTATEEKTPSGIGLKVDQDLVGLKIASSNVTIRNDNARKASEIWQLTAAESLTPIKPRQKGDHEDVVLNNNIPNEAVIVGNVDSLNERKDETDIRIEDQHEEVSSGVVNNLLESEVVTADNQTIEPDWQDLNIDNLNNMEINESKIVNRNSGCNRKIPVTRTDDFLWSK